MLDTIIIGSGPAGYSAAVYTARAGLDTLIITGELLGGLVATTEQVDNYLGLPGKEGSELASIFEEHVTNLGVEMEYETVSLIRKEEDRFILETEEGEEYSARSVIYAAGSTPKKLPIIMEGRDEEPNGVSYCATCDGMFFKDKPVVIVGGGETAAEDALYLSHLASSVDVIIRTDWKASETAVEKLLEQKNVRIHKNATIASVETKDIVTEGPFSRKVSNVSSVLLNTGEELEAEGLFVAIGQTPNSHVAGDHVILFKDGFIERSDAPGFFVAGDISNPEYRQIAIAVGDGAKAGMDVTKYLQ